MWVSETKLFVFWAHKTSFFFFNVYIVSVYRNLMYIVIVKSSGVDTIALLISIPTKGEWRIFVY